MKIRILFLSPKEHSTLMANFVKFFESAQLEVVHFQETSRIPEFLDREQEIHQLFFIHASYEEKFKEIFTLLHDQRLSTFPAHYILIGENISAKCFEDFIAGYGDCKLDLTLGDKDWDAQVKMYWKHQKVKYEYNQILGALRHDLRSPIGVLHTGIQMLEMKMCGELNKDQSEVIKRMRVSCDKFFVLIDELHP